MKKQLLFSLLLLVSFHFGFSKSSEKIALNCPTPIAVVAGNITFSSAMITWTESGTAQSWHILAIPTGSAPPTANSAGWVAASMNPFMLIGLVPNTSYDIYVRSDCSGEVSEWSGSTTITTGIAPPICGGNFIDQGGINGNYPNNSNDTVIICPTAPGDRVMVTFTSFNTETNRDALYVYDGTSAITSSLIPSSNGTGNVPGGMAGGYWGNSIPGPFISSTPDGCLTFRFISDANNTMGGWAANVECLPFLCENEIPANLNISAMTDTSVVLNWNNQTGLTSWEVILLPHGSAAPTNASTGTIVTVNPILLTDLAPNQCYTAYVRSLCSFANNASDWSAPFDFCMTNCENSGQCPQNLTLIAFLDANNNGTKDAGETLFNYGSFAYDLNNSGNTVYVSSNSGGFTLFENNPANSYNLSFVIAPYLTSYYSTAAAFNNITVPAGSGSNVYYFPVRQLQAYNDLQIYIAQYTNPRPGFTYENSILYTNTGTETVASGTITFTKNPAVSIASISQAGTTALPDGFSYEFTDLAPNETRIIVVTMQVPPIPAVNLGDILTNTTSIEPSAGDAFPLNNTTTLSQIVMGSYDPNDITESHGNKIVHSTFTANDYLYYTIQFENTGNGAAEFIRVEDVLDDQLDASTFEMLSSSHNVNAKRDGNQLTWHFYNINLPPTVTNPNESHGYIQFRIKPKTGYAIGDIIPNASSIYFDYNPAIVTNTFHTEFVATLGNPSFNAGAIDLYPNPANGLIAISNHDSVESIASINIYDILGKKVFGKNDGISNETSIDVSHFAKGMYLVELISEKNSKITKKLIIK